MIAVATVGAGVVGGVITTLGTASRAGLAPAPLADIALGGAVGLGCGVLIAPLGAWVGAPRRLNRVLSMLLFLPLGVCVSLGPFGNAPLTVTGALACYVLGAIAIAFFLPAVVEPDAQAPRCPVCTGVVRADESRCPHCAVQWREVSASNSSARPTSSSTRSA